MAVKITMVAKLLWQEAVSIFIFSESYGSVKVCCHTEAQFDLKQQKVPSLGAGPTLALQTAPECGQIEVESRSDKIPPDLKILCELS